MENFKNATARYLKESERKVSTSLNQIPLVIEPAQKNDKIDPAAFVAENSTEILKELTIHGAVLLRGFDVNNEKEFEQIVTSIKGMEGMPNYFMAEPGRTVVEGLKYVHYTNKNYKTGGTYRLGGFHTENYYTSDVPQFITFCCIKPSLFGGETGLVHMGNVYNSLSAKLKKKLGEKTFLAQLFNIKSISKKYAVSEDQIKEVCSNQGIPVNVSDDGKEFVTLYKPSVLVHPLTGAPALSGNISREVKGLDASLKKLLMNDYSGLKWVFHRLIWRYPNLINPQQMKNDVVTRLKGQKVTPNVKPEPVYPFPADRMGSIFSEEDIALLAKAVKDNLVTFTWKKGDILLIDNLQLAHSGMPGFGPRTIRALLCNSIQINATAGDAGSLNLKQDMNYRSLAATMETLKKQESSPV